MIRYLMSGESHGKGLCAIIEGLPASISLDLAAINRELKRRQGGYGRGGRMKIEADCVEVLTGLRNGLTLGSPLTLWIENKDWANWSSIMQAEPGADMTSRRVQRPRPGHADLAGGIKYHHEDLRNVLERSSARETAIRVAVGSIAQQVLAKMDIHILAYVKMIGGVVAPPTPLRWTEELYETPFYTLDQQATKPMMAAIDQAQRAGDTLGGLVEVVVRGLPIGIGSYVHPDRKLDGKIAGAMMGVQSVKSVEIGLGQEVATLPGSQCHDEIFYDPERGIYRKTNHAGGIEGGMSNGEDVVVRIGLKPIPTLYTPLASIDMSSKEASLAVVERSDTCAIPAASVVLRNVMAWSILESILEKFSGDTLGDVLEQVSAYRMYVKEV